MPHSHNIDYYIGQMEDESFADALADFEDPLDGRPLEMVSPMDIDEEFGEDELRIDFDDY
jgi:hypothetical protein